VLIVTRPDRPLRADAARNRARVLEVAYQTFAEQGLGVPIDDIAERAGVGAGTVYRHFPTKDALIGAVVADRLGTLVDDARTMLAGDDPGEALFAFLHALLTWVTTDRGLLDALVGAQVDIGAVAPDAEQEFRAVLAELVAAGQRAGVVRPEVTAGDVKALLSVCQAMPDTASVERVTAVVIDGLRAKR
jgi:AcrR family transcriptional regulator